MKLTILFVVVGIILFLWLRSVTIYLAVHKGQIRAGATAKLGPPDAVKPPPALAGTCYKSQDECG
jgi:hypothetical protein